MTNLTVGIFMKGSAHDILFEMGFRVGFTEVYGLDLSTASGLNHNPQPKMSVEKLKLQSKLKSNNAILKILGGNFAKTEQACCVQ